MKREEIVSIAKSVGAMAIDEDSVGDFMVSFASAIEALTIERGALSVKNMSDAWDEMHPLDGTASHWLTVAQKNIEALNDE